jgi:hypothetical protein
MNNENETETSRGLHPKASQVGKFNVCRSEAVGNCFKSKIGFSVETSDPKTPILKDPLKERIFSRVLLAASPLPVPTCAASL